jgi:hypothetical protein
MRVNGVEHNVGKGCAWCGGGDTARPGDRIAFEMVEVTWAAPWIAQTLRIGGSHCWPAHCLRAQGRPLRCSRSRRTRRRTSHTPRNRVASGQRRRCCRWDRNSWCSTEPHTLSCARAYVGGSNTLETRLPPPPPRSPTWPSLCCRLRTRWS